MPYKFRVQVLSKKRLGVYLQSFSLIMYNGLYTTLTVIQVDVYLAIKAALTYLFLWMLLPGIRQFILLLKQTCGACSVLTASLFCNVA